MGLGIFNVYRYLFHGPVCFAHENIKKMPTKVGYFSKIKDISLGNFDQQVFVSCFVVSSCLFCKLGFFSGSQTRKKILSLQNHFSRTRTTFLEKWLQINPKRCGLLGGVFSEK